jgi:hypothetical protein
MVMNKKKRVSNTPISQSGINFLIFMTGSFVLVVPLIDLSGPHAGSRDPN